MSVDKDRATNCRLEEEPMIYYMLPPLAKRRCLALKRISLEHELLDSNYRKERRRICRKFSGRTQGGAGEQVEQGCERDMSITFDWRTPMEEIARKADQLRALALGSLASGEPGNRFEPGALKELLAECEASCHQLLTYLANIDWELFEFEESMEKYHCEMEALMTRFNKELSALYKRRSRILAGECEPEARDCALPDFLALAQPPVWLLEERQRGALYAQRANQLAGAPIVGLPGFWLQALSLSLARLQVIKAADRAPLGYLSDVRYYYDTERHPPDGRLNSDNRTQLLLFYFKQNPHFTNRILSKTLHIDKRRRSGQPTHDGLWISKREGCTIHWQAPNDTHRQDNHDEASFFDFFAERGIRGQTIVKRHHFDEELQVELDYELFAHLRDFVAPHAIVAYSRGNLFGFESEHRKGASVAQKMYYLNSLFDYKREDKTDKADAQTTTD